MTDKKISSLDNLTTVDPDDEAVEVDKSDTTQAATGSTKKATWREIFQDVIYGLSEKTTPVDADRIPIIDTGASNVIKWFSWSNLKATLKTYFDTLYPSSNSISIEETPSGSINGSNTSFTLANTPNTSKILLYLNGQLLTYTTDYTLSGTTITMASAPLTGDILRATYFFSGSATGNSDTVDNLHASDDSTSGNLIPFYNGWAKAGETWTYASADDPTYTFTISGDKTSKYSPGMRIKLTQTTVKYFIITKVEYSSPNTTITVYGGTDYDLANAAITAPYYSCQKAPQGFPLDPLKWTTEATDVTRRSQANSPGTWYNLGTASLSIPIGSWNVSYQVTPWTLRTAAVNDGEFNVTLSTGNNSETDADWTTDGFTSMAASATDTRQFGVSVFRHKPITLTSKTTYYLNIKSGGATTVYLYNDASKLIIRAVCAYL